MIELENISPSRKPPGEIREKPPRAPIKGRKKRGPLWCPWWALGTPATVMRLWYPRDPRATEGLEHARRGIWGSPRAWSFVCQLPVARSVESCNVVPVRGIGVTVEDVADIPAKQRSFNPAGRSGPVDRGLPSATSSLKVRARTLSSYSRFQLHVNGGPSSSSLDTLTGFTTGRRLNGFAATAFSFCRWWPWSSAEHRSNGVARPAVPSSPLNLFLTI
jgi:hypothetical protein